MLFSIAFLLCIRKLKNNCKFLICEIIENVAILLFKLVFKGF